MYKELGLAPVVLFVYARPEHTQKTLDALKANTLAKETDIYIYIDAPKQESHREEYEKVCAIVEQLSGFKSIDIIKRAENFGLASNIIDGVSKIVERHGKVIVLEDDLVTSNLFLEFMNTALNKYKNNDKVWHISGWTYPVKFNIEEEVFSWRAMNCWGWATWNDKWKQFYKDPDSLIEKFTKKDIYKFNLDGTHNFWKQVESNQSGKLNTWAIFWYASIFENSGYCINPTSTFVKNIGNDGSGENCGNWDIFTSDFALRLPEKWSSAEEENMGAVKEIKVFFKNSFPNIFIRALRKAWRLIS